MNAVIIDDEKNGRDLLSSMLITHCKEVVIVATAASALEGIKAIQKHSPDLVFLDIQIPGLSAINVAASLQAKKMPRKMILKE